MELSILIAQIFGVAYVVMGLGFLINSSYFKKAIDDLMNTPGNIIYGAIMALVIGFFIVTYHNVWVQDWTVIITIIGWLSLIKGILLFLAPKAFLKFSKNLYETVTIPGMGVGALIVGVVMSYFGFLA